ncbi:MAG TPA: CARDB domain-containing protein [Baekduia sp.]|jgi:predicted esterase
MRSLARVAVVAGAVLAAAATGASVGVARPVARPDLVVAKGSVVVAVGGKATGRFVVSNTGRARAARSSAALSVRTAGRWRVVKRFGVTALRRGASKTIKIAVVLPVGLRVGALRVCADSRARVRERAEGNNCRGLGTAAPAPARLPAPVVPTLPAPTAPLTPAPAPAAQPPASSVPTDPFPFTKDEVFFRSEAQGNYWIYVPPSYDETHATPTTLFVWLHGCGGQSEYDISTVSPGGAQRYIAIALDGREGDCWDVNADPAKVMAAVADVKTHFNIDPHRVILGGYSSGGDLAYRTAFFNASSFAGVLAENTSPFRDTGSSQDASLAAAAWKFHVLHLAHTEDDTYDIDGVRQETDAMATAGFPITRIERPGHHYDADTATTGTDHDLTTLLLPHIDADGWRAP